MQVDVRRGPDRLDTFEQELLVDDVDLKITVQRLGPDFPVTRIDDRTTLRPGALVVWYLWPDRSYEVGAFHDRRGGLRGHYVNLIRPPAVTGDRWTVEDLFLDVWLPADGPPVILDRDELDEAVARGWVTPEEGADTVALAEEVVAAASGRRGADAWLPAAVRRWPAELVPALRIRRRSLGTFHAARLSGRIIAFGLYLMGAVSATSILFAWLTDAFVAAGVAQRAWFATIAIEAALLLPAALGGRLPATFWPRPPLSDERSLFVATLASGLAVLGLYERASWAGALLPVYGTLGLFSAIFAVCRIRFDGAIPVFAIAGIIVTLAALLVLI
ncbi:MAG: DUF402 domain-containing protein [Gemmatimonadota bacterium]|nr:DUF402 domain-containing protein [Gemmatimonadota bacterium]